MVGRVINLRKTRDGAERHRIQASCSPDGTLIVTGIERGPHIEREYGAGKTDYEWTWTIAAADARTLADSLGCKDVLDALKAGFSGDSFAGLAGYLGEARISWGSSERVGAGFFRRGSRPARSKNATTSSGK